jgi:hypothetical protein
MDSCGNPAGITGYGDRSARPIAGVPGVARGRQESAERAGRIETFTRDLATRVNGVGERRRPEE